MILPDFKHVRLLVTIFPEVLNVYSDALLETQIHRNFLAIMRRLETSANYPSTKEADCVPLQFMINLVFWAQTRRIIFQSICYSLMNIVFKTGQSGQLH